MNIGPNNSDLPPSYWEAMEQHSQGASGTNPHLSAGYSVGAGEPSAQSIAARSVSFTDIAPPKNELPPIHRLVLDKGIDLKSLNSLVNAFNGEIFSFDNFCLTQSRPGIVKKAHGLTRIPGYLNPEKYNSYNILTQCNSAELKDLNLGMSVSDFTPWFEAVDLLLKNTLFCCKADAANNPDYSALVKFLEQLLVIASFDHLSTKTQPYIETITHLKDELALGIICEDKVADHVAKLVAEFTSSLLTNTWDIQVFRETLDALFTLYEFKPTPWPLAKISPELNSTIKGYAMEDPCYDMFRTR
ncbi:hypothetical protein [Endozoicomonas sp. ONNA2]|uniref:hypothetical protein n=1 Tax=Endozoicomonas sp. ONNA2 TaxID=2828741 RepID=UPI0021499384|nr:hypothetical protein [Endozoicomonas sp. ONNA2]